VLKLQDAKQDEPEVKLEIVDLWQGLDDVPTRPVIVEGLLQRGVVTFVVGKGASAKSLFAQSIGLMVASGKPWTHWEPRAPGSVMIVNAEDDLDEQRRRLSATRDSFDARPIKPLQAVDLSQNVLFALSPEQRPEKTAAFMALERAIRDHRPDVVIIDPLVEHHALNENDNGHMALVVGALRRLARECECALLIVHHGRKGASGGDQDGARGASALVNAARAAITMEPMTDEQANMLSEKERENQRAYICVADAKMNYALRLGQRFLRLQGYEHANGESYPALVAPKENLLPDDDEIVRFLAGKNFSASTRGPKVGRADAEVALHWQVSPIKAKQRLEDMERRNLIHKAVIKDGKGNEKHVIAVGGTQGNLV
jgi:RecA-family ATPase